MTEVHLASHPFPSWNSQYSNQLSSGTLPTWQGLPITGSHFAAQVLNPQLSIAIEIGKREVKCAWIIFFNFFLEGLDH